MEEAQYEEVIKCCGKIISASIKYLFLLLDLCVYSVLFSYFRSLEGRGHGRHVLLVELEPLNSVQTPLGAGANI